MSQPFLLMPTRGGMKNLPLSQITPSTWRDWFGSGGSGGDIALYYREVAWFNRTINLVANNVATLPMAFHRGDAEGERVPTKDLPFRVSLKRLVNQIAGNLLMYGASYVEQVENAYGYPQFRVLHPRSITPQYDMYDNLVWYHRTPGPKTVYGTDELCNIWLTNRTSERGPDDAPAQAALRAAGVLLNTDRMFDQYYANGAIHPVLIGIEGGVQEADKERLNNWVQRKLSGLMNAFRAQVISGKISTSSIGTSPKDLEADKLTGQKREDISTAFGVPNSIVFSNAANFAVAKQDIINFYDQTVIPLTDLIVEPLNEWYFLPMGLALVPHPEELEVYQELEARKANRLIALTQRPILGVGEAREMQGLPAGIPADLQETLRLGAAALRQQAVTEPEDQADLESEESSGDTDFAEKTADLHKWRRVALNRLQENKLSKALNFQSVHLSRGEHAAIRGALKGAKTPASIHAIFGSFDPL